MLEELERDGVKPLVNPTAPLDSLPPPRAAALAKLCLGLYNHSEFLFID